MDKFYLNYYKNMLEYFESKFPDAPHLTLEEAAAHVTNMTIITTMDSITDYYKLSDRKINRERVRKFNTNVDKECTDND